MKVSIAINGTHCGQTNALDMSKGAGSFGRGLDPYFNSLPDLSSLTAEEKAELENIELELAMLDKRQHQRQIEIIKSAASRMAYIPYTGPAFKAVYCNNIQEWERLIKVAIENDIEIDNVLTFNQYPILYVIDARRDASGALRSKLLRSASQRDKLDDGLQLVGYDDFCKALEG